MKISVAENAEAEWCWRRKRMDRKRRKVVCRRHKGGGSRKLTKWEYWGWCTR